MNNQKCVIYARVSSREQEETGYSLDAQEKLLTEYAQKLGFTVKRVFRVTESASGKQIRKTFGEMLRYTEQEKIPHILCEKIDRLTRNLKDASYINDWIVDNQERSVHFVKEAFILNRNTRAHENLVWDMKVAIARFYTNNLSEEVKKGQKEKIAQGWIPCKAPIGYRTIGEKGHKTHILDEEKAPLIKRMFELYATGDYSILKLNSTMFELGLRTRGGNRLVKSRMASILGDPFYYGKVRWNGDITDGEQEPLISKELFDAVKNTLRSKNTPKYSKHFYLFKGILVCKECGGTITWERHKGHIYGHCNYWYKECSQKLWYKEPDIEKQIVSLLSDLHIRQSGIFEWVRKALKESHKDTKDIHSSAMSTLNSRLEQIQQRMNRLYDEKLDLKITEDFYKTKFREYADEKDQILGSMKKHTDSDNKYFEFNNSLFELAQRSQEIFSSIQDVDQKRTLLRLIFKELRIDKGTLIYEYTEAFKFLVEAINYTSSKTQEIEKLLKENFEPAFFPLDKAQTDLSGVGLRSLLRRQDSNL